MRKWKNILCQWIGIINNVKMTILPKTICKFNQNMPPQIFTVRHTDVQSILVTISNFRGHYGHCDLMVKVKILKFIIWFIHVF